MRSSCCWRCEEDEALPGRCDDDDVEDEAATAVVEETEVTLPGRRLRWGWSWWPNWEWTKESKFFAMFQSIILVYS